MYRNLRNRALTGVGVVAIATLVLTGCGGASSSGGGGNTGGGSSASGGSIKIGVALENTGNAASYGQSGWKGVQMAAEEWNAKGGINGKKIELDFQDTKSDPTGATQATTKLLSDGVVAVIGSSISSPTIAMAKLVESRQIPLISPTATNADVTVDPDTGKTRQYAFRACFIDPFQGQVMAKYDLDTLHAKKAAIITDVGEDYSKGLAQSFEQHFTENGGQIVDKESYTKTDQDFRSILTKVKQANPDVVYVPGYYNQIAQIMKEARSQLGMTMPFEGGDGWDSPTLLQNAGASNLVNTYYTNHYSSDDTSPAVQNFVKAYKAKYNATPDSFAALGYDAAQILFNAIKNAPSTKGPDIVAALEKTDLDVVSGHITFNAQHDPVKAAVILKFDQAAGKYVFDSKVNP